MAQSGRNVLVVDADLRLPTIHKLFNMPNDAGLSNVLKHEARINEVVKHSPVPGVFVLTSGPTPPNPSELLGSSLMANLIKQMAQSFDIVLLDAPALLAVTDAGVLAQAVDGVMLVVSRAQAAQEAVRAARQQLDDVKAPTVGVVVNRAEQDSVHRYCKDNYDLKRRAALLGSPEGFSRTHGRWDRLRHYAGGRSPQPRWSAFPNCSLLKATVVSSCSSGHLCHHLGGNAAL